MNCGFSKVDEENSYNVRNRAFILGKKRGWKAGMIRSRERRKALFVSVRLKITGIMGSGGSQGDSPV